MDIFRSEKAPYVLGLLVTIIGWHVSQLVNEIGRTQAVSYSVDVNRQTREVSALIRNVSRTKSLVDATFAIECADGTDCFEALYPIEPPPARGIYGDLEAIAPNAVSRQRRLDSAASLRFENTVAAGGQFRIVGKLAPAHADADVELYFIPNPDRRATPLDIYVFRRNTVGGLIIENYLAIVGVSLMLCATALIYSLFRGSSPRTARKSGGKK